MRFLWPTRLDPDPTAIVRFGRVLHWIGTILAIAVIAIGALIVANYALGWMGSATVLRDVALGSCVTLAFASVVYFAGRALRYIFSGE